MVLAVAMLGLMCSGNAWQCVAMCMMGLGLGFCPGPHLATSELEKIFHSLYYIM